MNDEFVLSDDDSNDHDCNNDEEMMVAASAKSANDANFAISVEKIASQVSQKKSLAIIATKSFNVR